MRLINVHDLSLKEFGSDPPPYAALSHRWTDDEISFKEFSKRRFESKCLGLDKIRSLCEYVKSGGLKIARIAEKTIDHVWIDTACIDKRSSAELSEAINSMWNIYKESVYCVVYLADVRTERYRHETLSNLKSSRWFTRGWTLQELIAPSEVVFCDDKWQTIGILRDDSTLLDVVSSVTSIQRDFLISTVRKRELKTSVAVARKLSWASNRQTTRPEDMAYCLLGLLDVNMPLLYGEGATKAFLRLQQVFIGQSDDESIFAGTRDTPQSLNYVHGRFGILADDIRHFQHARGIEKIHSHQAAYTSRSPYTITNKGLRLESIATGVQHPGPGPVWSIALNCRTGTFEVPESGGAKSGGDSSMENREGPWPYFGRRCVIVIQENWGVNPSRIMANKICPELIPLPDPSTIGQQKNFLIKLVGQA